MTTRKLIIVALILLAGFLLYEYYKNSQKHLKPTLAGTPWSKLYANVDPEEMREAIKNYKQPTLPPLTTPVDVRSTAQAKMQVLAEGNYHPPQPLSYPATAPEPKFVTPKQAAAAQEPPKSYIAPLESTPHTLSQPQPQPQPQTQVEVQTKTQTVTQPPQPSNVPIVTQ